MLAPLEIDIIPCRFDMSNSRHLFVTIMRRKTSFLLEVQCFNQEVKLLITLCKGTSQNCKDQN